MYLGRRKKSRCSKKKKAEIPSNNFFSPKECHYRSTTQERSKGEGVLEGFLLLKDECYPQEGSTEESEKEGEYPQPPPQKESDGSTQFDVTKTYSLRSEEIEEEKERKENPCSEEFFPGESKEEWNPA